MTRDKSFLFDFFYSTAMAPELVIAIAKDLGDHKNEKANYIDKDLTIIANKRRQYFS